MLGKTNIGQKPKTSISSSIHPIKVESGKVLLLDQRQLPVAVEYFDATELNAMCFAIKEMVVRGAPAIGVAAALGLAFESLRLSNLVTSSSEFLTQLFCAKEKLQSTRPTAVNLGWATQKIYDQVVTLLSRMDIPSVAEQILQQACALIDEDIETNLAIGRFGASLIKNGTCVLTHCNAGALATCGWGTALGVIRSAIQEGKQLTIYVDETRPRQQGSRLTAWELQQDGIPVTVIVDSAAASLMAAGKINLVVVGADRIASNGDTANKIGTYSLAVLANAHQIPFYVAAPISTVDTKLSNGDEIPIEYRADTEVTRCGEEQICPSGVSVLNPAFDVTPGRLITGIITEKGILKAPYTESIRDRNRMVT